MAEDESPHSSSDDGRKADLEALFAAWDQRDGAAAAPEPGAREAKLRLLSYGVQLRLVVSVVLIGITAFFMYKTRDSFSYWLTGDPAELGDLREAWATGTRQLDVPSNTYVHLDGLVISRVYTQSRGPDADPTADEPVYKLFFDPMFNIVVRTTRDLPRPKWNHMGMMEIDDRFIDLIKQKRVFPSDLTVSFGGNGRLIQASDVPEDMRRAMNTYARDTKLEADNLWVFLDDDTPSKHSLAGIVWGLAAIVPLVSLFFLLRAIRLRARYRQQLGAGDTASGDAQETSS
ncbi:MAG: hypothetical protein CVU56_24085 [Deltaproteobacteria bacterium HGW-Deltaproteobacteria-14]|jgi:hypothetical protein|nr:MAG: hypothetical protein CVU56_24085 [Deltaproteobacteria bacterium HGW-Deltaproteobacteria-14]